jgi:hypothetical protein
MVSPYIMVSHGEETTFSNYKITDVKIKNSYVEMHVKDFNLLTN